MRAAIEPDRLARIETEASEWLVAMEDADVSIEMRARFETWINADPDHARIYRLQEAAWNALPDMPHLAALKDAPASNARSTRSVWAVIGSRLKGVVRGGALPAGALAACVLVVAAGLWGGLGEADLQPTQDSDQGAALIAALERPQSDYATPVAQITEIALTDGSTVTLGAQSSFDVEFSADERRVVLLEGEAFFDVASDEARPFIVVAGGAQARVLGTRFNVRRAADAVHVSVEEGEVAVVEATTATQTSPASQPDLPVGEILHAGDQAVVAERVTRVSGVAVEDVASWREGRLVYVEAPLRDIIADADRYHDSRIVIADEAVGALELTASFRTDQVDSMLNLLTGSLPVEIDASEAGVIVVRAHVAAG